MNPTETLTLEAAALVKKAADAGLVLTVELRSLEPLAMGNYEHVIEVRPARTPAPEMVSALWNAERERREAGPRAEREAAAARAAEQEAERKRRAEEERARWQEVHRRYYESGGLHPCYD